MECEKGPNSDKQGFASLVKELRQAFTPRGLLLSAAVSASKRVIDAGKIFIKLHIPTCSDRASTIFPYILSSYYVHDRVVKPLHYEDSDDGHYVYIGVKMKFKNIGDKVASRCLLGTG